MNMPPAKVVCALSAGDQGEAKETFTGYTIAGIIIFIVTVIIILLAFHQLDMGIDYSWKWFHEERTSDS